MRTFLASMVCLGSLLGGRMVDGAAHSKTIAYRDGDAELEGYLAWDDSFEGQRPAVLVVHEWWGLNDYARKRADMLARLGYIAFALDMYGKGKVTTHPAQAGEWAAEIRKNVDSWRRRALKGLEILRSQDRADRERVAAIGYCFGGATVMELAYAGAPLRGIVSFHGSLPAYEGSGKILPRILACHGDQDPFVTADQLEKFRAGLRRGEADWTLVIYGGARHSFTNPDADRAGLDGLRYNAAADRRSWKAMQDFFEEIFSG